MRYGEEIDMWWLEFNSIKGAEEAVGGLASPAKMPSYSWSISARRCNIGSTLAKVKGSVCYKCYALKGRYMFPMVQNALERRYHAWESNRERWTNAMTYLMHQKKHIVKVGHFRWFDSGDIQGEAMLEDINTVAWASPHIKFWLPTKEYKLIKDSNMEIAPNLIVRVSNPNVNSSTLKGYKHISTVYTKDALKDSAGYICPSSKQGNICGDCRACWSDIAEVSYIAH
jgi:hypothetical protein